MYGITDSMDMNMSKLQEIVENRGAWRAAVPGVAKSRTRLSSSRSPTLSTPGSSVLQYLPEFVQIHVH